MYVCVQIHCVREGMEEGMGEGGAWRRGRNEGEGDQEIITYLAQSSRQFDVATRHLAQHVA